jgi:predicted glycosyltransferase
MNAPKETAHKHGRITIVNYLNSDEMSHAINQSEMVISRSGYSTVMDLMKLNKRSIVVPTPGQTEQEYIGKMLQS